MVTVDPSLGTVVVSLVSECSSVRLARQAIGWTGPLQLLSSQNYSEQYNLQFTITITHKL